MRAGRLLGVLLVSTILYSCKSAGMPARTPTDPAFKAKMIKFAESDSASVFFALESTGGDPDQEARYRETPADSITLFDDDGDSVGAGLVYRPQPFEFSRGGDSFFIGFSKEMLSESKVNPGVFYLRLAGDGESDALIIPFRTGLAQNGNWSKI